jgi:hypothetical protein
MCKTLEELVNFNSATAGVVQISLYYGICIYIFPTSFVNKGSVSTEKGM